MKIMAIETSCDETACAIVEDGCKVLANVIASQIDLHAKTGGVVPEVAAREHVLKMLPVIDEAMVQAGQVLGKAKCEWPDIDALAVTKGPGLISSLMIGTETASTISFVKGLPLIPVQHIVGHVYSNWLMGDGEPAGTDGEPQFPLIVLTVSGGHNELILMRKHGDFEVLGETRDDAAGEAFDKVARILNLGYPGGPIISKMALEGDTKAFNLPRAFLEKDSLDFSFSGLKTAVLNEVKTHLASGGKIDKKFQADMAASFQEAVVEVLAAKIAMAVERFPEVKEAHLSGGVSANLRLREKISEVLPKRVKFRFPKSFSYCTDNAAMVAAAAYFTRARENSFEKGPNNVVPSTSFEIWA